MTSDPDVIRQQIERTQDELSSDVNALTDKVSPRRAVGRRVERAGGALRGVKDKIMGSTASVGEATGGAAGSVTGQMSEAASSVGEAVTSAPQVIRERAQGSPLAVGVIAFGVGAVVSSLLPPSQQERQLAGQVKDTASEHADQVKQEVTGAAQQMRDELREPAQDAVESVKSTAGEAASAVRDEGRSATQEVKDQTQQAQQNVRPQKRP